MRPLYVALLLALFVVPGRWVLASQDSESPKVTATPLTNADVLDMLKAGVSQDVVIAKIRASACEFDTTPSTLKALKAAKVPDAVTLAMVEASSGPPRQDSTPVSSDAHSSSEPTKESEATKKQSDDRRRELVQKANDDFDDCKTRSQNEYDSKMNAIGTMALSPAMRVYAANKLKQNLDAELRVCRSRYESRLKAIEEEK